MTHQEKKDLVINYLESDKEDIEYWYHLYPFSTENLTGFLTEDKLQDKKVLLTGSSADQLITAQLYGAKEITCFDLNPLVEYLYDLKMAAIKTLPLDEFLDFFYYRNRNLDAFSMDKYHKIRTELSDDTKDFWDNLYQRYHEIYFRDKLFFSSEEELDREKYKNYLPYLMKENYQILRNKTNLSKVSFIETNVLDLDKILTESYDLIYFSNIFSRIEMLSFYNDSYIKNLYKFMKGILEHVNENGVVMLDYLYSYNKKDFFDFSKKYAHHIQFPVRMFKCQSQMTYQEVDSVVEFSASKKDTMVCYTKKKQKDLSS